MLSQPPRRPPQSIGSGRPGRLGFAWSAAILALALVPAPAPAAWLVPPDPYRAKDFTIVKRDGWYHCFYIRTNPAVPPDSTERDLGHAISQDMYFWTHLPPVLPARPDEWDNWRIWAPSIIELDDVYYMFYTGVTERPGEYAFHQRIGLATSTDLMTWNRLDEPVLSCAQIRWTYCNPMQAGGGELRDSFVMPNPAGPGWLMYYTATPVSAPGTSVTGMAASSGDLTVWENREPLWISHTSWTGSSTVESPHLFQNGGLWYLMFTGNGTQPLRVSTGTNPVGGPGTWIHRGTLASTLGIDTHFWFASEVFVDGTHEYLCFVNYDRVDLREIVWSAGWQFTLQQPDLLHVQSMTWSAPEAANGETVELRINAVNASGRLVAIEAVEVDPGGIEEPIPLAALGLPQQIPLTGPVTTFSWAAKAWPDPDGPDGNAEIVVRLADRTAATPPISVPPTAWIWDPGYDGGDGDHRIRPELFPFGHSGVGFRSLNRTPTGDAALLVDLQEATMARLDVFDLAGRKVRELADRTLPAGATVIPWDGREAGGARVRPGVYFARLTTPHAQQTARILVRD